MSTCLGIDTSPWEKVISMKGNDITFSQERKQNTQNVSINFQFFRDLRVGTVPWAIGFGVMPLLNSRIGFNDLPSCR